MSGHRSNLTIETAADLIWSTNGPEFFTLLVHDRSWPQDHVEQWLAELWAKTLLR